LLSPHFPKENGGFFYRFLRFNALSNFLVFIVLTLGAIGTRGAAEPTESDFNSGSDAKSVKKSAPTDVTVTTPLQENWGFQLADVGGVSPPVTSAL
jgi:hypothetical protein